MSEEEKPKARAPAWIESPRNLALILLLQGLLFLAIGLVIFSASGGAPAYFIRWEWSDVAAGLLLTAAMVGSMQGMLWAFPGLLGWAAEKQRFLFSGGRPFRLWQIIIISLSAGIGEEALFRGGLQTGLSLYMPAWGAILLSSLLFTLVHLGSPGISAFLFAYSLAFGAVYQLTGSLLAVMLAHALFDVWAIHVVQRELVRRGSINDDAV